MIRSHLALYRQAQEMFLKHLVGVYRWDEVKFDPKKKRPTPPVAGLTKLERRRLRREKLEGKFEQTVSLRWGIWVITITSPTDHPPLGLVTLTGYADVEGPLDPVTWDKIGEAIKQKTEELRDVDQRPEFRAAEWG